MKLYKPWQQYKTILIMSLILFVLSNIFIQFFTQNPSLSAACKWDCGWYTSIIDHGYYEKDEFNSKGEANWAFFPAFPIVANFTKSLFNLSTEYASVITSKFFLFASIISFIFLVERDIGKGKKLLAGMVITFNPYIIYAHVGYTETLYFFLSSIAFMALSRSHWIMTGLAASVLSATKVVGVIFILSYSLKASLKIKHLKNSLELTLECVLGLLLIPLGLATYMLYLYFHTGDALAFSHIQAAWSRSLSNPFVNLWVGLLTGGRSTYMSIFAVLGIIMSVWLFYKEYSHYAVFLMIATLLPLATGLESLPRYVIWQVPFLFGVVVLLDKLPWLKLPIMAFSTSIAGFMTIAWFSDKAFIT